MKMVGATTTYNNGLYYNQYQFYKGLSSSPILVTGAQVLPTMVCLATPPKVNRPVKTGWELQKTSGSTALCLATPSRSQTQSSIKTEREKQVTPTSKGDSPSPSSPTFYAGAKFNTPPAPTALPKPPSHWTKEAGVKSQSSYFTEQLKLALNVKA